MKIHGDEKEHREVSNLEVPLKSGKQTALVRSHRGPLGAHQGQMMAEISRSTQGKVRGE